MLRDQLKRTALLAFVLVLGLTPGRAYSGDYQTIFLPVSGTFSDYQTSVRNDTITILTYYHPDLILYKISNNQLVTQEKLRNSDSSWGWYPVYTSEPRIEVVYGADSSAVLWRLNPDGTAQTVRLNIGLSAGSFRGYLVPLADQDLILNTRGEDRFAISSHNLKEEYSNWQSYKIADGKVSDPVPIQTGRHKSYSLHTAICHDTVFAAWDQLTDQAVLSSVTDRTSSIEFAFYDGQSWTDPISLQKDSVSVFDSHEVERRVLGVYRISTRVYLFWSLHYEADDTYRIIYRFTDDLKNWSSVRPLPITGEYQDKNGRGGSIFWEAGNSPDSTLHLLLRSTDHPRIGHYLFDGESLTYQGELIDAPTREYRFAFDGSESYLFFKTRAKPDEPSSARETGWNLGYIKF